MTSPSYKSAAKILFILAKELYVAHNKSLMLAFIITLLI